MGGGGGGAEANAPPADSKKGGTKIATGISDLSDSQWRIKGYRGGHQGHVAPPPPPFCHSNCIFIVAQ